MKVYTLTGPALDWAVATCEGLEIESIHPGYHVVTWKTCALTGEKEATHAFKPSTYWAHGGPIIEREHIGLRPTITEGGYRTSQSFDAVEARIELPNGATTYNPTAVVAEYGPTPLIAAMRCYVASKLGDEVDIPKELE